MTNGRQRAKQKNFNTNLTVSSVVFRKTPIILIPSLIITILAIGLFNLLSGWILSLEIINEYFDEDLLLVLSITRHISFSIMLIFILILYFFDWKNKYYTVRSDSVTLSKGTFFKNQNTFFFRNILKVRFEQTFWGNIFDYGTIILDAHLVEDTVYIKNIMRPKRCLKVINDVASQTKQQIPISADPVQ